MGCARLVALAAVVAAWITFVPTTWAAPPAAGGPVDLLTEANLRIDGAGAFESAGNWVDAAGDVNGDGRPDVIIGAFRAANRGDLSGSAYVVFGRPSLTTVDLAALGTGGFRIDGAAPLDLAGNTVAGVGDMNGDGLADVIVGAPGADHNGREDSGSAYVVFGKVSPATVDLAALGSGGFRIDGAVPFGNAGASVEGAGDVNGDGRPDVIVGAVSAGSAYVVFGKASPGTVNLASLGTGGFRMAGGRSAGASVDGVGDVNGDGRSDLIVGAFSASNNGRDASGSAYVVFGKSSMAPVNLVALGAGGFRIDGAAPVDQAGLSVSGPGDVDGDGRPDVMVGAFTASNNGRDASGSAYVVFGKASTAPVDLAALGAGGFRIDGAAPGDQAGTSAGAGDVNGDGRPDVIVGASSAGNNARPLSGSAYVVFGKSSTGAVDLAALGAGGFRIDGAAAGDLAGAGVAGAGDLNLDGHPDVIVGAFDADNNLREDSGSAYIVFGFGPGKVRPGRGCGDKNHVHERRGGCKKPRGSGATRRS